MVAATGGSNGGAGEIEAERAARPVETLEAARELWPGVTSEELDMMAALVDFF